MLEISQSTAPDLGGGPMCIRVLLLDDDAFDRKRICRYSEQSGLPFLIKEAQSLDVFAALLNTQEFDLILIDYQLAEGDGLQALKLVQGHDTNSAAATVMITGQGQTNVAVSAFRQGCHDFIQKDEMSPHVIRDVVLSALQQSAAQSAKADVDPARMVEIVEAAMQGDSVRNIIKSALSESVRTSVTASGLGHGDPQYTDEFLQGFLQEDEFFFKH